MSRDEAYVLEWIYGRLDSAQYRHILENVFLPSARESYPKGILLFQEDIFLVQIVQDFQVWLARRPEIEVIL